VTERLRLFLADPEPVRGMGTVLRAVMPVEGRQNGDAKLLLQLERKTREPQR